MKRAALLVAWLTAGAAAAQPPVRLLFAVGNNVGDPDDAPLRFAEADARRVALLFEGVGQVAADRAYVVIDETEAHLRERFAELSGRVAELAREGKPVELVVYVSAHAKGGELHLDGTHLGLSALRDLAERTAARTRVLIIDACDSGAGARRKGGMPGPEYDVHLDQLPLAGTVLISSSGPAEPSQEWDSLGGSLFTHHLLTGLRGDADADGDGRVTLAEAYGYAYRRTVLEAVGQAQHPAFDLDLTGAGELVLAWPGLSQSAVIFPSESEGHYVLASQPRPDVVAEVDKKSGRALRLAVPAGRYTLRKRLDRSTGLLALDLPYGGERVVDEAGMVRRSFVEVVTKGGNVELHPWSLLALGQVETPPFPSNWGRWRAGLAVRRTEGSAWMQLGLLAGSTSFRGQALRLYETSMALQLAGGYRWVLSPVIPYLGARLDVTGFGQSFLRDDEAVVRSVYGSGKTPFLFSVGVSVGPEVGVEIPLWRPFYAWVAVTGRVRLLPVQNASSWSVGADAQAGAGWVF